jgi:hypothetical protein
MAQILQHVGGVVARQSIPPELAKLPPELQREYILASAAMRGAAIPKGADMTMTTDGPDQIWFLVVAITCIATSGLFLMVRIYTKLAVVRSFEPADCELLTLLLMCLISLLTLQRVPLPLVSPYRC